MEKIDGDKILICKKITYKDYDPTTSISKIRILLGIKIGETDRLLVFQTRNKRYALSKDMIISIVDTNEIFEGCSNDRD